MEKLILLLKKFIYNNNFFYDIYIIYFLKLNKKTKIYVNNTIII